MLAIFTICGGNDKIIQFLLIVFSPFLLVEFQKRKKRLIRIFLYFQRFVTNRAGLSDNPKFSEHERHCLKWQGPFFISMMALSFFICSLSAASVIMLIITFNTFNTIKILFFLNR